MILKAEIVAIIVSTAFLCYAFGYITGRYVTYNQFITHSDPWLGVDDDK